ncbi:ribose-phosphate diphosphokinase [Pokkaliibacter sp. CJK22405]|uniref:ribose-phosphate diphosphokinase n=1 Tax=Pokkaliibacter sp. CJK22405 TaxID=3384615 RepID=UPI003984DE2E
MLPVLFNLLSDAHQAERLCKALEIEQGVLGHRHFPDGEHYLRLLTDVTDRHVIIYCSLTDPDSRILPLLFLAKTARKEGARFITLMTPYLPYMRQDECFNSGEAVTADLFAALISEAVDELITVDPHLHRYDSLSPIYSCKTRIVSTTEALAQWISSNVANPLIIGPDAESAQWVIPLARKVQAPHIVLEKLRRGDRDVSISTLPQEALHNKTAVVVDDIISSGQTILQTLIHVPESVTTVVIGIHGVLADKCAEAISSRAQLVCTNTRSNSHAEIDVLPALIATLAESISTLG